MKPIHFPEANSTFTAEGCLDVPACILQKREDGKYEETAKYLEDVDNALIICCWEPDIEELHNIIQQGRIYLGFVGGMVPHEMYAAPPFDQTRNPSSQFAEEVATLALIEEKLRELPSSPSESEYAEVGRAIQSQFESRNLSTLNNNHLIVYRLRKLFNAHTVPSLEEVLEVLNEQ